MDINQSFKLLNVSSDADSAEITRAYKKLAIQYHPDKNRKQIAWANEAMTMLNIAYSNVMAFRFRDSAPAEEFEPENDENGFADFRAGDDARRAEKPRKSKTTDREELVDRFARIKNSANSSMYKYFQYSLYNLARRDTPVNAGIFNNVVKTLRRAYHACRNLADLTDDAELKNHFAVFSAMLFHFYRASECMNIIDSYKNQYDVDAYREYKKGDEYLHLAHREMFYDRHNRGYFKGSAAMTQLQRAEAVFSKALRFYPESNWVVEIKIKYEYTVALKDYLNLFFTE